MRVRTFLLLPLHRPLRGFPLPLSLSGSPVRADTPPTTALHPLAPPSHTPHSQTTPDWQTPQSTPYPISHPPHQSNTPCPPQCLFSHQYRKPTHEHHQTSHTPHHPSIAYPGHTENSDQDRNMLYMLENYQINHGEGGASLKERESVVLKVISGACQEHGGKGRFTLWVLYYTWRVWMWVKLNQGCRTYNSEPKRILSSQLGFYSGREIYLPNDNCSNNTTITIFIMVLQYIQYLLIKIKDNIIKQNMGNDCNICQNGQNTMGRQQTQTHVQQITKTTQPRPSVSKNDQQYFKASAPVELPLSAEPLQKRDPFRFSNGIVYDGEWRGQLREGYGVQVWPDGARYEGYWYGNKANGKGKFIHVDGDVYEGEWENDKASGQGIYYHGNGAKYDGQWLDDLQHGYGVETWVDGSKYEGQYQMGKKGGRGKYIWKDGSQYDGDWKDNKITGNGLYVWADGRKYSGSWLNNQMHGYGRYEWRDGRMYEGHYQSDKKYGTGTYRWADGRKYVGEWVNSKRHGKGKIIGVDGSEREGIWEDDKRVKWIDQPSRIQSTYSKFV